MNEAALYKSSLHGKSHIHRVLLLAALNAQKQGLSEEEIRLYFDSASYHDVGRIHDGRDDYHGARSAEKLEELTGQTGENLLELKVAVTAHSRMDLDLENIIRYYQPKNYERTLKLARLLKDADNLDRVRIRNRHSKTAYSTRYLDNPSRRFCRNLDINYLRCATSKELAPFALYLWDQKYK